MMKDWMIRAIKTFVQAFLGVLIPEVCALLTGVVDISDWSRGVALLCPVICAALAAGISAAWNIISEQLK